MFKSFVRKCRMRWLLILGAATFAALMLLAPPVAQPQAYHHFADARPLLPAIPNTLNVLSNAAFALAGALGLAVLRRPRAFANAHERRDALAFFLGTLLTAIGSSLYHLAPRDATLVYDRAGMVVAFMAFLAMTIHERYDRAPWLFPTLLVLGLGSVAWWRVFDDLRPYLWVQFFPIVAVIAMVVARRRYTGEAKTFAIVVAAYVAAKLFEELDAQTYAALGGIVSGHTLKHLFAACAPAAIAGWIARRDQAPPDRGGA
jgi:hypothetical protein